MAKNEVRIIGGKWRGRKLRFPNVAGLRPSMGRTRDTLFNWLQADLPQAHCLDLFAGAGALGFEAASRGAARVDMVDNNAQVVRGLHGAKEELDAKEVHIHHLDAQRFLGRARQRYQIVFIDPPFDSDLAIHALRKLYAAQDTLLAADILVYLEIDKRKQGVWDPLQWHLHRDKLMGDSRCMLLQRLAPEQTDSD